MLQGQYRWDFAGYATANERTNGAGSAPVRALKSQGGEEQSSTAAKGKPPNCCNSLAARRASENADTICKQSNRETSETQVLFL